MLGYRQQENESIPVKKQERVGDYRDVIRTALANSISTRPFQNDELPLNIFVLSL
jgi:hypothetical protein